MPQWQGIHLTILMLLALGTKASRELRAEFIAQRLALSPAQAGVPDNHPLQTSADAPGLPQSCLTYNEKYMEYDNLTDRELTFDPNELNPFSRYVILVRMHYGIAWRRDLVLYLRSLKREAASSGLHLYLLFQVAAKAESAPDDTPEKFRHSIPPEFRPIAYMFEEADVHNAYSKLHKYIAHMREYLPLVWFLHRFPGYEFAWYIEYDVRYTGQSLGVFFNAALWEALKLSSLALSAADRTDATSGGVTQPRRASNFERERYGLPPPGAALPDLLILGDGVHTFDIDGTNKPRDRDPESQNWNFTRLYHRQLQVVGVSRKLANTLHLYSNDGLGGFIEEFIPSLAMESNLTVVSIPIAEYIGSSFELLKRFTCSFHCCTDHAETYYAGWYQDSGSCRRAALLHPIKLQDRMWKALEERGVAPHGVAAPN